MTHSHAHALFERYDPRAVLRQSLPLVQQDAAQARSALLVWLLGLPAELDPAQAAAGVRPLLGASNELTRLLDEVASYPRARLLRARSRRAN